MNFLKVQSLCEYSHQFPRQRSPNDSAVLGNGDVQTVVSKFPTLKVKPILLYAVGSPYSRLFSHPKMRDLE